MRFFNPFHDFFHRQPEEPPHGSSPAADQPSASQPIPEPSAPKEPMAPPLSPAHQQEEVVYTFRSPQGRIRSPFDPNSTLIRGLTRYGYDQTKSEVFALRWNDPGYTLKVLDYPPVEIICDKEDTFFTQNGKIIATSAVERNEDTGKPERFLAVRPEAHRLTDYLAAFEHVRFAL